MRAVLDACVLYPTVLRQILLEVAGRGGLAPCWSQRLVEEWRRTALRLGGAEDASRARAEAGAALARFPDALVPPGDETPLWLPDPADIHVLATAIAARAEVIVTLNLRDFPARELAPHGLRALAPDALLLQLWRQDPDAVAASVTATHATAERLAGEPLPLRALLVRARLPRLGKALHRAQGGVQGGAQGGAQDGTADS